MSTSAWMRRPRRTWFASLVATRAELALSFALLGGWALVTAGLAALTTPKIWFLSGGGLLLSLCGWEFCWQLARKGLYTLTRERRRDE